MDYNGIYKESLDIETCKLSKYEYSIWFYDDFAALTSQETEVHSGSAVTLVCDLKSEFKALMVQTSSQSWRDEVSLKKQIPSTQGTFNCLS